MMQQFLLFLSLLILSVSCQNQTAKPDQVIEIFRHGTRGPNYDYDPQWSSSEVQQLTKIGMIEHYNLGKKIAEKYPHLVASGYNPDDVYVVANYVQRCIESAMAQLSSIFRGTSSTLKASLPKDLQADLIAKYEPLLSESESERGDYVPVKVNVASTEEEKLFFNGKDAGFCNKMTGYLHQNEASPEMKKAWEVFQIPANQANAQLPLEKQKITDLETLNLALDAFMSDVFDKRPLPGGINDTKLIESLNYGAAYYLFIREQGQLIQRQLTSFHTLEAILEQIDNFRFGKSPKKLVLYGGHDKNLLAILAAFGVITEKCLFANYENHIEDEEILYPNCRYPDFASNLIFEFYNDTSSPYVKFYYDDVLISLCNGQDSCSYQDFRSLVRTSTGKMTLKNWNDKCGNFKLSIWVVIGPVIAVIFAVIVIFRWKCVKKREAQKPHAEDDIMLKQPEAQTDDSSF